MKSFQLLPVLSFLLVSSIAVSQVPDPELSVVEAAMSEGVNKCIMVHFADIKEKEVEKIWQDYAKKRFKDKSKKVRKTDEYLIDDASISGMTGKQRVFVAFREGVHDTEMRIWIDNGNGFINPEEHPSDYSKAREAIIDFNRTIEKYKVQEELDGEEKVLKALEKDMKSLEKEKDKLEDGIKKYERTIEDDKKRIKDNEDEQDAKSSEIRNQENVIDEVNNKSKLTIDSNGDEQDGLKDEIKDELKDEKKILKSLKKDLKSLRKEKDKLENEIRKLEKKIEENNERIPENENEQEAKASEIKIQEGVIDEVKDRLRSIDN